LLAQLSFFDFSVEGSLYLGGDGRDALLRLDFSLNFLSRWVLLGNADEGNVLATGLDLAAPLLAHVDLLLGEADLVLVVDHLVLLDHAFALLGLFGGGAAFLLLVLLVLLLTTLLNTLLLVSGTTRMVSFWAGVFTTRSLRLAFKSVAVDEVIFIFEDTAFGAGEFLKVLLVHVSTKSEELSLVDVALNSNFDVLSIISDEDTLVLNLNVENVLGVLMFGDVELDKVSFVMVVLENLSLLALNWEFSAVHLNMVNGLILLGCWGEHKECGVGENDLDLAMFTLFRRIDNNDEIWFINVVANSNVFVLLLPFLE